MTTNVSIRKIAFAGAVAALYAAMTIALSVTGYGPIQFRVAEVLCILPFFFPFSVWGLFTGCIIANLLSPYFLDIVVGPMASLIAGTLTMLIGKADRNNVMVKALACIPPVVVNAVFIGAMIAYYMTGAGESTTFFAAFMLCGAQVGIGQFAVLYALGLPLMIFLPKSRVYNKLLEYYEGG